MTLNVNFSLIRDDLSKMGPVAFSVLLFIASYLSKKRNGQRVWPHFTTIWKGIGKPLDDPNENEYNGVGRDKVYKAIKLLKVMGYIKTKQTVKENGDFGKLQYWVDTDKLGVYMPINELEGLEEDEHIKENGNVALPDMAYAPKAYTPKAYTPNQDTKVLRVKEVLREKEILRKEEVPPPEILKISETAYSELVWQFEKEYGRVKTVKMAGGAAAFEDLVQEFTYFWVGTKDREVMAADRSLTKTRRKTNYEYQRYLRGLFSSYEKWAVLEYGKDKKVIDHFAVEEKAGKLVDLCKNVWASRGYVTYGQGRKRDEEFYANERRAVKEGLLRGVITGAKVGIYMKGIGRMEHNPDHYRWGNLSQGNWKVWHEIFKVLEKSVAVEI